MRTCEERSKEVAQKRDAWGLLQHVVRVWTCLDPQLLAASPQLMQAVAIPERSGHTHPAGRRRPRETPPAATAPGGDSGAGGGGGEAGRFSDRGKSVSALQMDVCEMLKGMGYKPQLEVKVRVRGGREGGAELVGGCAGFCCGQGGAGAGDGMGGQGTASGHVDV